MTPHAKQVLRLKPRHGGAGITSLTSISRVGYPASLAAAIWTVSLPTFNEAREFLVNLPPIQEDEDQRGNDLQMLRQLEVDERTQNPEVYSPTRALITVWTSLSTQSSTNLQRIFGFQFDPDEAPCLDPSLFPGKAASMKIQREMMSAASDRSRDDVIATRLRTLEQLHSADQHLSVDYRNIVRQLVHGKATGWKYFYTMQPWIANFRVESDHFCAYVRTHLIIRSQRSVAIAMDMKCNCRLKEAPPRTYTDPDYHALTCGYNALIQKRHHNHIVTKTVAVLNQMGVYRAREPVNPEAPDFGSVPDAYLNRNPESEPLPSGSPEYDSLDVTVVTLVQASDYKCRPGVLMKPNRRRPLDLAYDRKATKHHPQWKCLPLVLDISATLHGKSRKFLEEAKGAGGTSKVLFFRKECAAAICRMIGTKHKRTMRQRTEHIVTNVETSEAMATFMAEHEQDEQRALEELSPDDVTNWSDMPHQPTDDDSPAVLEPSQQNLAIDLSPQ